MSAVKKRSLHVPGKTNADQQIRVAFASVLTYTTKFIGDTLRTNIGHAGNVHRLGAQESTPAIISLGTGMNLEKHLKKKRPEGHEDACAVPGGIWNAVLDLSAWFVDRNRAAPVLFFYGNRFEFRAVGSAQNVAFPLTVLNTAMTEGMSMLCNTIVVSFYNVSVFRAKFLFADVEFSQGLWQALTAHQSIKEYELQEYIFAFDTDENVKTIIGGMTEFLEYIFTLIIEENCKISNGGMNKDRTEYPIMGVYVRTVNGKTISSKCDRQKAARLLERKTSIPRGMMHLVNQGKVLNDNRRKQL